MDENWINAFVSEISKMDKIPENLPRVSVVQSGWGKIEDSECISKSRYAKLYRADRKDNEECMIVKVYVIGPDYEKDECKIRSHFTINIIVLPSYSPFCHCAWKR